jgi:hypothetical protein
VRQTDSLSNFVGEDFEYDPHSESRAQLEKRHAILDLPHRCSADEPGLIPHQFATAALTPCRFFRWRAIRVSRESHPGPKISTNRDAKRKVYGAAA